MHNNRLAQHQQKAHQKVLLRDNSMWGVVLSFLTAFLFFTISLFVAILRKIHKDTVLDVSLGCLLFVGVIALTVFTRGALVDVRAGRFSTFMEAILASSTETDPAAEEAERRLNERRGRAEALLWSVRTYLYQGL